MVSFAGIKFKCFIKGTLKKTLQVFSHRRHPHVCGMLYKQKGHKFNVIQNTRFLVVFAAFEFRGSRLGAYDTKVERKTWIWWRKSEGINS